MLKYLGASRQKMDDRGRVHVPVRWSEHVSDAGEMMLTAGPSGSLLLLEKPVWEETATRVGSDLLSGDKLRMLRALFVGHAEPVTADKNGRIQISEALRKYADFGDINTVFLMGTGSAIEIWSQDRWNKQAEAAQAVNQLFDLRNDPGPPQDADTAPDAAPAT